MCDEDQSWESFSWQAQYLVMLEGDSCYSAYYTGRVMCDEDQSWGSFFVAGALFGEVQPSLFVAAQYLVEFRVLTGSCSDHSRIVVGSWSDRPRTVTFQPCLQISLIFWNVIFVVHYLVMLEGDAWCSAHCTGRLMLDADQSWNSFFLAAAIFGDVCGWLLLLRLLHWTFHLWWRQIMRVICTERFMCDEDKKSWGSFVVASAIFVEVGGGRLILRTM